MPTLWCSDGHIHFSIRKANSTEYIEPSRYMEKRDMKTPKWTEQCDHYQLIWLVFLECFIDYKLVHI